jgi:signal transduction histidine kinase
MLILFEGKVLASNQLERVFLNVLVNAWHAMPQAGTVTIRAEVCDDHYVRVSCRDTGMGMSAEALTRTFEPFSTTKAGKGTGLGLAICRQIVDGHPGSIALNSLPWQGHDSDDCVIASRNPSIASYPCLLPGVT